VHAPPPPHRLKPVDSHAGQGTMSPLRKIHSTAPAYPTWDLSWMAVGVAPRAALGIARGQGASTPSVPHDTVTRTGNLWLVTGSGACCGGICPRSYLGPGHRLGEPGPAPCGPGRGPGRGSVRVPRQQRCELAERSGDGPAAGPDREDLDVRRDLPMQGSVQRTRAELGRGVSKARGQ
jgi:hypothetical protein